MSEVLPDFYGFLTADQAIAAIVSDRVLPFVLEETTVMPALTYQVISLQHENLLEGRSTGLNTLRLQVDCWAETYATVDALSWAVRAAFDGYHGAMGAADVNITLHDNLIDQFEPEDRRFRRVLDFLVIYGS